MVSSLVQIMGSLCILSRLLCYFAVVTQLLATDEICWYERASRNVSGNVFGRDWRYMEIGCGDKEIDVYVEAKAKSKSLIMLKNVNSRI